MGDDDLTERLREKFWYRRADGSDKLAKEAADEIERLRARIAELEDVIRALNLRVEGLDMGGSHTFAARGRFTPGQWAVVASCESEGE